MNTRPVWLRQSSFLVVTFVVAFSLGVSSGAPQRGITKEARETAEAQIREIQKTLDELVTVYKAGNIDEARKLAMKIGDLYEGQVEGMVAKVAAAKNRQLDPLLEATIPAKVRGRVSVKELETLIERAHKLLSEVHEKIEATE